MGPSASFFIYSLLPRFARVHELHEFARIFFGMSKDSLSQVPIQLNRPYNNVSKIMRPVLSEIFILVSLYLTSVPRSPASVKKHSTSPLSF